MNLIIAANWKMHKNAAETAAFCRELRQEEARFKNTDILICPPFTALWAAREALSGSALKLGAQNMHWEEEGAYTGEVAPSMLVDSGVRYVIIGHSERRHLFGERSDQVGKKIKAALKSGLKPILCVGETGEQRAAKVTEKVLEEQLASALKGVDIEKAEGLVVAYEPVWAIGTGQAASPEDAEEAASFIRQYISAHFGKEEALKLRVQYGGSVNPDNIGAFVTLPSVAGALVGGASLEPGSFIALIKAARKAVLS